MDIKLVEKLMIAMGRTNMKRLVIKEEGFEIELESHGEVEQKGHQPYVIPSPWSPAMHPIPAPVAEAQEKPLPETPNKSQEAGAPGKYVTSPMVGTFYAASSPDDPAFVKVGDNVDEESVICIIEAMKVMNEVKSGIKGQVAEVLVKNGDPVEFGTKIIRIV